MQMLQATPEDTEQLTNLVQLLRITMAVNTPRETDYPGITSLMVMALVFVAGEMLHGVPVSARPSAVAHFQDQLSAVAMDVEPTRH